MKADYLLMPECRVYFPYSRDERAGGPTGFISQNFADGGPPGFSTTPDLTVLPGNPLRTLAAALDQGAPLSKLLPRSRYDARRRQKYFLSGAHRSQALWFHDAGTYGEISDLVRADQTVIYQPHTPELPWEELDDPILAENCKHNVATLFERADWIVLPSVNCGEIYRGLLNPTKLIVIESACNQPPSSTPIPLQRPGVYFLYIGRRNNIKGFDLALAGFERARQVRNDIFLIFVGRGQRIAKDGVIDLGPQLNVHDWIASANCVINMNRQSYFDLSVMETLAVGTPLIFTMTGGHKDLLSHRCGGLHPISVSADSLAEAILEFPHSNQRPSPSRELRAVFELRYSSSAYRTRLVQALPQMLSRNASGVRRSAY